VDQTLIAPDGIQIGWDEAGEGRPLLLVHPGVADARACGFVRQHLPDGLRVAALDRRGRGRSGRADEVPHSLDVEADGCG
jgi:pimeloyl-ACP methyl ester carboxylesterase